jgi:hypothetical protein
MKKKNKQVKAYNLGGIILLLAIVALIAALVITGASKLPELKDCGGDNTSVSKVHNVNMSEDGVASSDTATKYYLFVPWTEKHFWAFTYSWPRNDYKHFVEELGANYWGRSEIAVTLTLRFNDIIYYRTEEDKQNGVNGMPVIMYANAYFEVPSVFWVGTEYICKGSNYAGIYANSPKDIKINIRETYYQMLKDYEGRLGSVTVGIYSKGGGWRLSETYGTDSVTVSSTGMYLKEGESESGDIDPGDNGGVDPGGTSARSFWELLYLWYKALPVWGKVLVWVGIAVVILGIISLFAGLFVRK